MVQAALQATNKREREASSAASGCEKKKATSSKSPAVMTQFEELSSQFMSFLSNEQAEGEYIHVTEIYSTGKSIMHECMCNYI